MLTRYKKMFNKIAMGFLSFMPDEKDLQKLQMTLHQYETEHNHQLFLWKEDGDFIGIIGILFLDKQLIQIQHLAVNPSHRDKGVGKMMIKALKELHPDTSFIPNEHTDTFYDKSYINESLPIKN